MAGENIQFEEIKMNYVQNFKKREYDAKNFFLFFRKEKLFFYFSDVWVLGRVNEWQVRTLSLRKVEISLCKKI